MKRRSVRRLMMRMVRRAEEEAEERRKARVELIRFVHLCRQVGAEVTKAEDIVNIVRREP